VAVNISTEPGLGLEELARQTLIILMRELNQEIEYQEQRWAPKDEELANLQGVEYTPVEIERVEAWNFRVGHRPSLVEAPIENYPNVAVLAYSAAPSPAAEQFDQLEAFDDRLAVEIMCKGFDESMVNARTQRTADAAYIVLARNRTFDGIIGEQGRVPSVMITDLFPRREGRGEGRQWWWQGARIDGTIVKHSPF